MESWDEIRAGADVVLRLLASGLVLMAAFAVKALLPVARAALVEVITTRAATRWRTAAGDRATAILDPTNPATSVEAQAADMMKGVKDAAAFLGGTQADAKAAIERAISERRVEAVMPLPGTVMKVTEQALRRGLEAVPAPANKAPGL